jgi:hypothetical protein
LRQQANSTAAATAPARGSKSSSSRRRQVRGFADYDDEELWEDNDTRDSSDLLNQDQAGASLAVPSNPWLVRRQQQQSQRQQRAKQAASAAAAAEAAARQKAEEDAEQLAVQQQLLRQQEWQAYQQQRQQQEQFSPRSSTAAVESFQEVHMQALILSRQYMSSSSLSCSSCNRLCRSNRARLCIRSRWKAT